MLDGVRVFADGVPEEVLSDNEQARLKQLEREIESAGQTMGEALREIQERRLYRVTHERFEDYVAEKLGLAKSTAYDHINAARVRRQAGVPKLGHAQCVAIAVLPQDRWAEVGRDAVGKTSIETKRLVRAEQRASCKYEGDERPTRRGRVPGVLKVVSRAAEALQQLSNVELEERLSTEQIDELRHGVEVIREQLSLIDACSALEPQHVASSNA